MPKLATNFRNPPWPPLTKGGWGNLRGIHPYSDIPLWFWLGRVRFSLGKVEVLTRHLAFWSLNLIRVSVYKTQTMCYKKNYYNPNHLSLIREVRGMLLGFTAAPPLLPPSLNMDHSGFHELVTLDGFRPVRSEWMIIIR